jgi:uncharacterized membrane protein
MALIGRLHPLLVHFPIGLVLISAAMGAALATAGADGRSRFGLWVYRTTLFWAAALVAITGHLGGLLVWGRDLRRL